MRTVQNFSWLKFVPFSGFDLWDTKRYTSKKIVSKYPIEKLGNCISEESTKYKLFDEPETEFGILGVNNKEGIFDAYLEKGKEINQAYKRMEIGWVAYNPYRINVGSIGVRKSEHKFEYISPAYVVFSCRENLFPEYLFLLFKTKTFNKVINESTTGSVRQNLTFEILKSLEIPLPPLSEQQKIVEAYERKINDAQELQLKAQNLEADIEKYLFEELGVENQNIEKQKKGFLQILNYKTFDKWGVDMAKTSKFQINSKFFPIKKVMNLCSISSGGTPNRSIKKYYEGNIPWIKTGEVINDIIFDTEEKITEEAIQNSSAKIYPKGSLIMAMYGQGQTRGRTAKLGIDASTNQACAVFYDIKNEQILTDFFWIYLMSQYHNIRALASGNNQPNLNAQMIKNYDVIVPPLEKQKEISDHISEIKKEIERLRNEAGSLKERAEREFEETVFKTQ